MKILVAGASGYIGQAIARRLAADGHRLVLLGNRNSPPVPGEGHVSLQVGPLEKLQPGSISAGNLQEIEAIIDAAGRAHVFKEHDADPEAAFIAANADSVAALLRLAAEAGTHRFVLISSIAAKLLRNAYGRSKRTGEELAFAWSNDGQPDRQVVALRPPLVYGPGAPGNIDRLARLIEKRSPLPFRSVKNRRSFLHVDNLADAVAEILAKPGHGPSGTYEICDDDVLSLPDVISALDAGRGSRSIMLPFPSGLMRAVARRAAPAIEDGLFGDLLLDNSALKADFGWSPRISTRDGLAEMARHSKGAAKAPQTGGAAS